MGRVILLKNKCKIDWCNGQLLYQTSYHIGTPYCTVNVEPIYCNLVLWYSPISIQFNNNLNERKELPIFSWLLRCLVSCDCDNKTKMHMQDMRHNDVCLKEAGEMLFYTDYHHQTKPNNYWNLIQSSFQLNILNRKAWTTLFLSFSS